MAVRPPAYVRSIARDVLAVSVGFGLGISYSLVGGTAPDFADLPAEERRSEQSSTVSAATRGQTDRGHSPSTAVN